MSKIEKICGVIAILFFAVALWSSQAHASYVIGIWPGSSCPESSFHATGASFQNEGCYTSGLDAYNIYSSLKLFVVTCAGDSASSSWRIQGMRQYCNVYNLDFTGSGNGCVKWGGYGAIDASVRISCDNKGWAGFPCTNNGQDAFCSSGICRTRCCNANTDLNCVACSDSGQCTACGSGYVLSGSSCLKPYGTTCTSSGECLNSRCAGTCCRPPFVSLCATCDSFGTCIACPVGSNMTSAGGCMAQDGYSCSGNSDCLSGKCGGSHCCSSAGVDPYCNSCYANKGLCNGCASPYVLNGTVCSEVKATTTSSGAFRLEPSVMFLCSLIVATVFIF